jgi:hypothetical protein
VVGPARDGSREGSRTQVSGRKRASPITRDSTSTATNPEVSLDTRHVHTVTHMHGDPGHTVCVFIPFQHRTWSERLGSALLLRSSSTADVWPLFAAR